MYCKHENVGKAAPRETNTGGKMVLTWARSDTRVAPGRRASTIRSKKERAASVLSAIFSAGVPRLESLARLGNGSPGWRRRLPPAGPPCPPGVGWAPAAAVSTSRPLFPH